jgi:hypothetical protein
VAMIVVLLEQHADRFSLRQEAVSHLARLGITDVAVARDEHTAAVVLEGWLFDPLAAAPAVTKVIGAEHKTRVLHPVMHLAVSAAEHTKEVSDAYPQSQNAHR